VFTRPNILNLISLNVETMSSFVVHIEKKKSPWRDLWQETRWYHNVILTCFFTFWTI